MVDNSTIFDKDDEEDKKLSKVNGLSKSNQTPSKETKEKKRLDIDEIQIIEGEKQKFNATIESISEFGEMKIKFNSELLNDSYY